MQALTTVTEPLKDGRPRPRSPFGPPLDDTEFRGALRRFWGRSYAEQEAFVARLNWNLVDTQTEAGLFNWLAHCLTSDAPNQQTFALKVLGRLPHPRRARYVTLFAQVRNRVDEDLTARLAEVFGPVLGGPPKSKKRSHEASKPADAQELEKLRAFFQNSGKARS